jgi:hypothetical protein
MQANRITGYMPKATLPNPPAPAAPVVPQGFVFCPGQLSALSAWQQEIYRLAYERAQAAARIPRHHRQLFSVWN